jgi:hypothetical protein
VTAGQTPLEGAEFATPLTDSEQVRSAITHIYSYIHMKVLLTYRVLYVRIQSAYIELESTRANQDR